MAGSGAAGHGLDVHRHELDPALVARVETWGRRPELSGLYERLCGQQQRRPFMDAWAEVIIADRLDQMGCDLEVEVPTPRGRTCDLRVRRDGREFYVHIKRFHDGRKSRRIRISPRLRVLEGIERPWLVRGRGTDGLDDAEEAGERRHLLLVHRRAAALEAHLAANRERRGGGEKGGCGQNDELSDGRRC